MVSIEIHLIEYFYTSLQAYHYTKCYFLVKIRTFRIQVEKIEEKCGTSVNDFLVSFSIAVT